MGVMSIAFVKNGDVWESLPIVCRGGDMRLRVHKKGPYPVDVLVSIDGVEEYIRYDDFGFDELKCEVTVEGAMRGQHIKLASRSEITLLKCLEP
ncbi:MAG: hypothetical protein J6U62_04400 [Bacteroidaceae bacterium]|jgi:hypothetical protein|nr:hypothetical protein [Bacteroidaceae bacterium]